MQQLFYEGIFLSALSTSKKLWETIESSATIVYCTLYNSCKHFAALLFCSFVQTLCIQGKPISASPFTENCSWVPSSALDWREHQSSLYTIPGSQLYSVTHQEVTWISIILVSNTQQAQLSVYVFKIKNCKGWRDLFQILKRMELQLYYMSFENIFYQSNGVYFFYNNLQRNNI